MATEAQILANRLLSSIICRLSSVVRQLSSPLYNCRESSTNQLLFMQNKPNFQKSKMNANLYNTMNYENKWPRRVRKNKPNSNPNKPNLKRAQMNINLTLTKDYRKKDDFEVRINKPNSNPTSQKPKINANLYFIEDYENISCWRPQKNKPKQTQFQTRVLTHRSDVCLLSSVLCSRMQPKLLNFLLKNSLTVGTNSVKYLFLCNERECFYEKLYGKKRPGRA